MLKVIMTESSKMMSYTSLAVTALLHWIICSEGSMENFKTFKSGFCSSPTQ